MLSQLCSRRNCQVFCSINFHAVLSIKDNATQCADLRQHFSSVLSNFFQSDDATYHGDLQLKLSKKEMFSV